MGVEKDCRWKSRAQQSVKGQRWWGAFWQDRREVGVQMVGSSHSFCATFEEFSQTDTIVMGQASWSCSITVCSW
jgi:hypothetical protein